MGWTVLYIAFGIVALWLLGEVLLQYKARLRWRLLAFGGFSLVVVGVLIPSILVIVLGAIAFAVGQTYVTLSFRRGFSTGWALGGKPGASRRRRGGGPREERGPALQVSELEAVGEAPDALHTDATATMAAVYEPEPMPDDTGQYGVYSDQHRAPGAQEPQPEQQFAGYEPYAAPSAFDGTGQGGYEGQGAFAGQDPLTGQYDYGTPQQYAAYSDPYVGTGATTGAPYDAYDSFGNGYDSFGSPAHAPDPYAQQYAPETPPGGVWVPQQREGEPYPPPPPEQPPAPFPNGYNNGSGYDEQQYRY
ncbi:hypothetical protein [Streptomyces sp. NPDC001108]